MSHLSLYFLGYPRIDWKYHTIRIYTIPRERDT